MTKLWGSWESMAQHGTAMKRIHGPVGQREAAIAAGTSEGCLCSQPEVNCFRYWFKHAVMAQVIPVISTNRKPHL